MAFILQSTIYGRIIQVDLQVINKIIGVHVLPHISKYLQRGSGASYLGAA
jgi:hypothetical protein